MAVTGLFSLLAALAALQTSDPADEFRTRSLWDEAFIKQRPQRDVTATKRPASGTFKARQLGNSFVGVTLWRMRRSSASDPIRFRGLEHPEDSGDTQEWTPQRIGIETPVQTGQWLRLSLESARKGYLYVIDRDVYPDGTTSLPNLVFPTTRLRGGDNRVQPGVPIEIPDLQDKPPVFRIKKTRPDQTGVLLTVIVAPEPIAEISIGREAQKLTDEQLKRWERKWGSHVQRLEAGNEIGKPYTASEQAAARDASSPLGDKDPAPLTLFHCNSKQGDPMLISIPIKLQR